MADMTPERLAEKVGKQLGLKTTYIERLFGNKPGSPIFDLMAEDVTTLVAALESTQGELNQLKSWLNAMRGPNAHRVGCDCGGGPGNGHYCGEIHKLMGWEGQFNAKVSP